MPSTGWRSLLTVVATTVGGALGVAVAGAPARAMPLLIIGLGVISMIGIVVVNLTAARPGRVNGSVHRLPPPHTPNFTDPRSADPHLRDPQPPEPRTADPLDPSSSWPAPERNVTVALPLPSAQWWNHGPPAAGAAPPTATPVAVPELESYLASSRLAQCPHCGSFDLTVTPAPPGYDFTCRACPQHWRWQPGLPWPPMRMNPRRRRSHSPYSV